MEPGPQPLMPVIAEVADGPLVPDANYLAASPGGDRFAAEDLRFCDDYEREPFNTQAENCEQAADAFGRKAGDLRNAWRHHAKA